MADQDEVMYMLGEIKGQLNGVQRSVDAQGATIASVDKRLRKVEKSAAVHGAVGGGLVGFGVALISESVKAAFKSQGT